MRWGSCIVPQDSILRTTPPAFMICVADCWTRERMCCWPAVSVHISGWVGGTAYIFWKVDGDAHHLIEWHLGIIIIITFWNLEVTHWHVMGDVGRDWNGIKVNGGRTDRKRFYKEADRCIVFWNLFWTLNEASSHSNSIRARSSASFGTPICICICFGPRTACRVWREEIRPTYPRQWGWWWRVWFPKRPKQETRKPLDSCQRTSVLGSLRYVAPNCFHGFGQEKEPTDRSALLACCWTARQIVYTRPLNDFLGANSPSAWLDNEKDHQKPGQRSARGHLLEARTWAFRRLSYLIPSQQGSPASLDVN